MENKNENKVSVIIITHNSGNMLYDCLNKLDRNDPHTARENSEWIVIDNASTDGSVERVLSEYPSLKVIKNSENKGFAFAANQGLRAASNEYLLYINTDVEIRPLSITRLLEVLTSDSSIAVVGPRLLRPDGSIQKSALPLPSYWDWILQPFIKIKINIKEKFYQNNRWYYVPLIRGACFLIRKSLLEIIGGFDEEFYFYYEETDLFYRLGVMKYKIAYYPLSEVVHIGGATVKKVNFNAKKIFRQSYLKYLKKHHPQWQYFILQRWWKILGKI